MLRNQESFGESVPKLEDVTASSSHHSYAHYSEMFTYQNNCHDSLVYVMPSDSSEGTANGDTITKNTGSRWREDETEALVEIWRDKICQTRWWKQSKGVRVNKEMWEEISQLLAEREVYRTASQCQIRMKNLLQFYRQAVDTRRSEKSWDDLPEYFDIVDRIMTRREHNTNNNNSSNEDDKLRVTASILRDEDVDELRDVEVENVNGVTTMTSGSETKQNEESVDSDGSSKKRSKFESDIINMKTDDKRKYEVTGTNGIVTENGYGVPRYSVPIRAHVAPTVSTVLPNYFPRDQTRWLPGQNMCCEASAPKRFCFGNEKDTIRHLPEFPGNHSNYVSSKGFIRTANQHIETKQSNTDMNCSPTDNCHVQGCSNRAHKKAIYAVNNLPSVEAEGHNNSMIKCMQDFMQLQHKQMETFIDIERQRLDTEKQRLREEQERGNRNTAFLMEAVKILAETFRTNEPTNK